MDLEGLEPSTPTMPLWCAPSCATGPYSLIKCSGNSVPNGAEGTRTPDLYSAIVALSHLSYSPSLAPNRKEFTISDENVNRSLLGPQRLFGNSLSIESHIALASENPSNSGKRDAP